MRKKLLTLLALLLALATITARAQLTADAEHQLIASRINAAMASDAQHAYATPPSVAALSALVPGEGELQRLPLDAPAAPAAKQAPNLIKSKAPDVRKALFDGPLYLNEKSVNWSTGAIKHNGLVRIEARGDSAVTIYNLGTIADTLEAIVNAKAGTVSIMPKKVRSLGTTYGDVWLVSAQADASGLVTLSTTQPVTGNVDSEGVVTLHGWGLLVPTGTYKGYGYGLYSSSTLNFTNAVVTEVLNHTGTDSTVVYPIYAEQTMANQMTITNWGNLDATIDMTFNSDSTTYITPQLMFSSPLYGDFYCYRAEWTATGGRVHYEGITGQGDATSVKFGNWAVYTRGSSYLLGRRVMSSTINLTSGSFVYPAAPVLNLSGSGTEADPWVINTAQQLQALGEKVYLGETYQGKHFALGADIDLSAISLVWRPIGRLEHPFAASFHGNGHTIKNLNVKVGEEKYYGIFGCVDTLTTIDNVKLDAITMDCAGAYSGLLVGRTKGNVTGITVTNSTLTHRNAIGGGIVGCFVGPLMSDCTFSGVVAGQGATGGVVGQVVTHATRLVNHGTVAMTGLYNNAYNGCGGVVGELFLDKYHHGLLEDSYNDGTVQGNSASSHIGGVVGDVMGGVMKRCFNMGPLFTSITKPSSTNVVSGSAGGLCGNVFGGTITDCYNANVVRNSATIDRVGGLVGYVISPVYTYSGGRLINVTYTSLITNSINYGQVLQLALDTTQGLYGTTYTDTIFVNCYYDQQLTGNAAPKRAMMATRQLTAGTLPEGYDASVWNFTAGLLPRLKSTMTVPAAIVGASPLTLAEGETTRKVKHDFITSSANAVQWRIFDATSSRLTTESTGLVMSGDTVKLKNTSSTELMQASLAGTDAAKLVTVATVDPSGFVGSGTESDPYLINDLEDLILLNKGVTKNSQTYEGDYFKQTADIDCQRSPLFKGIACDNKSTQYFEGTYDGQGYAIHNLWVDSVKIGSNGSPAMSGTGTVMGFIGAAGEHSTIKNVVIAADCHFRAYSYVGAVAGVSKGTITGCRNYAPVECVSNYAGGIAGSSQSGLITDCYNAGTVSTSGSYAAGIVGSSSGVVSYCQNDGMVIGDSIAPNYRRQGLQTYVGGIVAFVLTSDKARVEGCVNTGTIKAAYGVAGITVNVNNNQSPITGNINYGMIVATNLGKTENGAIEARMVNAYNTGAFASNYYDGQIATCGAVEGAEVPGTTALTTASLTSGTPLDSLEADRYSWSKGLYPVLKSFAAEPMADAHRRMVVTCAPAEGILDLRTQAQLMTDSTLSWTLAGGNFTIGSDGVLTPRAAASASTSVRDTLTATIGTYTKQLPLRSITLPFAGAGTQADPFQIKTKDDMLALARISNGESYPFNNCYFKMMNDIDFDTTAYEPIAVGGNTINCDFDGAGHKLENINYVSDEISESYVALFGTVGRQGSVHDLILGSGNISMRERVAGFVAKLYGTVYNCENHATIQCTKYSGAAGIVQLMMAGSVVHDCANYGSVASASSNTAGIAGIVRGGALLYNCVNYADLTSTRNQVAGVAGDVYGTVSGCENKGAISGTASVAGIAAYTYGGTARIDHCVNRGKVTATSNPAGGILAMVQSSSSTYKNGGSKTLLTNCYNTADVTSKGTAGGVLGNSSNAITMIDSCYNTGTVTTTTGTYTGGVVGQMVGKTSSSMVSHSYNTGDVIGVKYTGGIVGYLSDARLAQCRNYGNVLCSSYYVGGLAGSSYGDIDSCYNVGNAEADRYAVGGIAGLNYGSVNACFNAGKVTANGDPATSVHSSAGGIAAYAIGNTLYAYNLGEIHSKAYAAGITANFFRNDSLRFGDCYAAGPIVTTSYTQVSQLARISSGTVRVRNNYYDIDVNGSVPLSSVDSICHGVTTRELVDAKFTDGHYTERAGMYPVLTIFAGDPVALYCAATPVLAQGDTPKSVSQKFDLGCPEGTVWTCDNDNLVLGDGYATPVKTGTSVLTKTYVDEALGLNLSRSYTITITGVSGVDDVNAAGKVVAGVTYYNTLGQAQAEPFTGVNVVVTRYTDGTTATAKQVFK